MLKILKATASYLLVTCCCVIHAQVYPEKTNLIVNPGIEDVIETEEARKLIPEEQHRREIQYFQLAPGRLLPREWLPYSGGGYGIWGATDEQAHSGKYSIFLTFKNFHKSQDKDMAVLFINTKPVEVEPDTEYEFSFWIKGNIPLISIKGFIWNEKEERISLETSGLIKGLRKDGISQRGMQKGGVVIAPGEQWSQYSLIIKTTVDSKRLQMRIGLDNMNQPLVPGQTIYVDDVRLISLEKGRN